MPVLKDLLYKVPLISTSGDMTKTIDSIHFDSRKVVSQSIFIAIKGTLSDGHQFIDQAIEQGAIAVICESPPEKKKEGINYIVVKNCSEALGIMAANFYQHPAQKLKLVAITGTNGKTTTATLLYQLFRKLGYKTGLLSTVVNKVDEYTFPSKLTTPDALAINQLLYEMVKAGCTHCFMEASSHAIVQHRITGLDFSGAVFMNISHDHLDYHHTFDAYIKAKKQLFDQLPNTAFALVNKDDKRSNIMLQNCSAIHKSFALKTIADYKARVISNTLQGLELEIDNRNVWFKLIGDFNAYNLMAAFAVAHLLGEEEEEILKELSNLYAAPGRFEQVQNKTGITAIVDYAHTPDALENVLKTIKNFRTGNEQVITVVGCGGNRDKSKRPLMAKIACSYSNRVILTSDNPRNEDPETIIQEMQAGVDTSFRKNVLSIVDRREAIKTACALASTGDIILVAGKGHETYQEINGIRHDFDDKIVLKEAL